MKKNASVLAVSLAASLLFTACGSSAPASSAGSAAAPAASSAAAAAPASAEPVKITIWYEGNDSRLPYFKAVEAEMQKDYPNYSIEAVTFDNATLMTKSLQAVTTVGGVDLVFNEASRLLQTHLQSNGGYETLDDVLAGALNKEVVNDADLKLTSQAGQLIVFPVNRSMSGLGVKTDVSGVTVTDLPTNWDQFTALGQAYVKAGVAGFTLHLGNDQGQGFNLFLSGSGKSNVWLNSTPESQIQNNLADFAKVVGLYAGSNSFWDKDAINEDFAAMYTKIQSGSVGMFRAGNWNVANWDKPDSGVGEYTVTTWPSIDGSSKGGLVLSGIRGMAMPKNAPNKEAAKIFLKYAITKPAQEQSFATMGSCVDVSVVDTGALSKNQKIFFDPSIPVYPFDNYASEFTYYPALLETYEKGLVNAFYSKSEDEITKNLEKVHADLNKTIEENK